MIPQVQKPCSHRSFRTSPFPSRTSVIFIPSVPVTHGLLPSSFVHDLSFTQFSLLHSNSSFLTRNVLAIFPYTFSSLESPSQRRVHDHVHHQNLDLIYGPFSLELWGDDETVLLPHLQRSPKTKSSFP